MSETQNMNPLISPELPPLSDEASVEVLDFLHELVFRFEGHYSGQIFRYYDQHKVEQIASKIAKG